MLVVISCDIQDDGRRTRLARRLRDFGPRVQKSVFEADIEADELVRLCDALTNVELNDDDSIRLYRVCAECVKSVRIWGKGEVTKDQDFYVV